MLRGRRDPISGPRTGPEPDPDPGSYLYTKMVKKFNIKTSNPQYIFKKICELLINHQFYRSIDNQSDRLDMINIDWFGNQYDQLTMPGYIRYAIFFNN